MLGELQLAFTPLVVAPLEVFDIWGLKDQPALLFGMDCLQRFRRVSIDYGRKELRFEVASARTAAAARGGAAAAARRLTSMPAVPRDDALGQLLMA